jgi:PAS domain-containing protein
MSCDDKVLGTFGLYNREVRHPGAAEMQLIDQASRIAGIAIERHRTEKKLRESERELRQITDAVPQALGMLDPKGGVLYANQTTLDYTGFKAEDVLAPNFRERIFHPDDLERLRHERKAASRNCEDLQFRRISI